MKKAGCLLAGVLSLVLAIAAIWFVSGWWGSAEIEEDTNFIVPSGASLTSVAEKLAEEGVIADPQGFLLRAKILGSSDPILAGEFLLPAGASSAAILDTFQHGEVIRRFVTIPEGLPSILVHERLMAEDHLTGEIPVPVEGSVLPDTYDFERGEARSAVLARMQAAMQNYLAEAWPKRAEDIAVDSVQEAVILA
ncbi:MAG TPA: aminodeoxychorismate lyase, partial [Erythrobacter sp.]|nr:aminodeoxychorismate lyase [Erythrobacter sp.]